MGGEGGGGERLDVNISRSGLAPLPSSPKQVRSPFHWCKTLQNDVEGGVEAVADAVPEAGAEDLGEGGGEC